VKVETKRTSFFGWNCSISMDGCPSGDMTFAWMGRSGTIVVAGESFHVRSQGLLTRSWDLWQGSSLLASASKRALGSQFEVDLDGVRFELQRPSLFGRGFVVKQGSGTIGSLERGGWFSRNMVGDLPDTWAPEQRAFVMWLVMMVWRRRARSRSS
jgi:hypothetical protein